MEYILKLKLKIRKKMYNIAYFWFDVDVLDFLIKLHYRYFGTFGLGDSLGYSVKKLAIFFKTSCLLVSWQVFIKLVYYLKKFLAIV